MNNLLRQSKVFLDRNAPTILTSIGGVGVIVTAVLTAKATPKAIKLVETVKEEKPEATKFDIVRAATPAYIPSIVAGASTIACIFGANVLNKRKQAALMSAYALLDSSYKDYKKKVKELYGKDADDSVRESIAKDKYEEVDIPVQNDKQLFYDEFSKRYFESTVNEVQQAEYHINRDLSMRDYATVNEFYGYLGLDPIPSGDDLGWSTCMNFDYYWQSWIDFGHSKIVMDDGRECFTICMFEEPTLDWANY